MTSGWWGADLIASKGRFLPSLESRLSHNRQGTSSPILSKTRGLVRTNQSYSMDTNLNWSLVSGGRNLSTLKAEKISKQMAELNYERTRQDVALKVAERYLACLKARRMVEISEQALERSKAQLERTEALFRVGSVPRADVLGQKVQLGTERLKLIKARMDYKEAVADLLFILRIEPRGQELELRDIEIDLTYEDIGFKEALQRALENLRLAEERYRLGSGILLDQITASVQLREAEADHVSALYDYMLAWMRLKNAMGTLESQRR